MKSIKFITILFLSFVIVYILHDKVAYINSIKTCAKIGHYSSMRGRKLLIYYFNVNENISVGNIEVIRVKDISLDSLKKFECIEIEYSKIWSGINRITDKRILEK